MADVCVHENTRIIGDMPICDPETYEYVGRFDVLVCNTCGEFLDRTEVVTK